MLTRAEPAFRFDIPSQMQIINRHKLIESENVYQRLPANPLICKEKSSVAILTRPPNGYHFIYKKCHNAFYIKALWFFLCYCFEDMASPCAEISERRVTLYEKVTRSGAGAGHESGDTNVNVSWADRSVTWANGDINNNLNYTGFTHQVIALLDTEN